ncbi:hypothetical protein [Streptomyces sp. NPDC060205]|uniref:hypothetical protein n=1 Tax=Streptomyces sp. NPDC060205 TaxID=3347072 RepID=UPI003659AAD8
MYVDRGPGLASAAAKEVGGDAATTGDIRPAISAYDLLRTMASIVVPEDTAYTKRMIALLVDGLRYQPGT